MTVAVVGSAANEGTRRLVERWVSLGIDAELTSAADALRSVAPDVVVVRLDVVPSLDGVEAGLHDVFLLERRCIDVRNPVHAVLAAHDKLRTARLLGRSRIPHPATRHFAPGRPVDVRGPIVLKPRFGSWGVDVCRCRTAVEVDAYLRENCDKSWYRRQGVLAQEDAANDGCDLRVLVAGGRAVGAIERRAAPGEWRTNISCGGSPHPVRLTPVAAELATTAAAAIDADLVGVDLLPVDGERYVVLELNAAVDFDDDYSLGDGDVYAEAAAALGLRQNRAGTSPPGLRGLSDAPFAAVGNG